MAGEAIENGNSLSRILQGSLALADTRNQCSCNPSAEERPSEGIILPEHEISFSIVHTSWNSSSSSVFLGTAVPGFKARLSAAMAHSVDALFDVRSMGFLLSCHCSLPALWLDFSCIRLPLETYFVQIYHKCRRNVLEGTIKLGIIFVKDAVLLLTQTQPSASLVRLH